VLGFAVAGFALPLFLLGVCAIAVWTRHDLLLLQTTAILYLLCPLTNALPIDTIGLVCAPTAADLVQLIIFCALNSLMYAAAGLVIAALVVLIEFTMKSNKS
jgi:hypothetical protein